MGEKNADREEKTEKGHQAYERGQPSGSVEHPMLTTLQNSLICSAGSNSFSRCPI